jgi:hypothetical protein
MFSAAALGQMNDNFVCCPDEALEWRSRRYHIVEEIVEYCPDVVCLQVSVPRLHNGVVLLYDLRRLPYYFSFTSAYSPGWTFGLPFLGFLITHIQTRGKTPLDE